jgi:hypothetical protein
MMRALAHPARIAIWQHLGREGPAYRRLSCDERPAGVRRVQVTVDLVPWFEPPAPAEHDTGLS